MLRAPISIACAPHYTWGQRCDGWHLVRTPALSIIEERMPPGATEVRHVHAQSHQFFYMLAGELILELNGEEYRLLQNEGMDVPAGVAHQAFNRSAQDARFLVTSQPPSHGDRTDA